MKKNDSTIVEGFPPLMCHEPRVLILGTIPGKNSISAKEYYYIMIMAIGCGRCWQN